MSWRILETAATAALCSLFAGSAAYGETIATCGGSDGYMYMAEGGLVSENDAGFAEDEISAGGITLNVDHEGQPDILYRDATERLLSASADGAVVLLTHATAEHFQVVVINAGSSAASVETYLFNIDHAEVVWTQNRASSLISKGSLFRAACTFY